MKRKIQLILQFLYIREVRTNACNSQVKWGLVWLIAVMLCLQAASRLHMFVSAGNR